MNACLGKHEEANVIGLVKRMKKGSKKGYKKKKYMDTRKKDLSKVVCL